MVWYCLILYNDIVDPWPLQRLFSVCFKRLICHMSCDVHQRLEGHGDLRPAGTSGHLSPAEDEPSFMVPAQHPARDAVCTIPVKAEEELKDFSRKRTDDGTGKQYIEFLGLRLLLSILRRAPKDGRSK